MNILNANLTTGILHHEPIEDYHANKAISSSGLRTFMEDPLLFRNMYVDNTHTKKESAALEFGKAIHAGILENAVILCDNNNIRTKAGKDASASLREDNPDAIFLKESEFELYHNMLLSVDDCIKKSEHYKSLDDLKENCYVETTYRVRLKSGLYLQCRPDAIDTISIWDLKTTTDLGKFEKSIYYYGYHIQAGFYHGILKLLKESPRDFRFIAVEKSDQCRCGLFSFSADQCEYFWKQIVSPAIEQLHDYVTSDRHDGKFSKEKFLEIPEWINLKYLD